MKAYSNQWDKKYLSVIRDERFALFGFTMRDILSMKKFLDIHAIGVQDLEDGRFIKNFHQIEFIKDAIMTTSGVGR